MRGFSCREAPFACPPSQRSPEKAPSFVQRHRHGHLVLHDMREGSGGVAGSIRHSMWPVTFAERHATVCAHGGSCLELPAARRGSLGPQSVPGDFATHSAASSSSRRISACRRLARSRVLALWHSTQRPLLTRRCATCPAGQGASGSNLVRPALAASSRF